MKDYNFCIKFWCVKYPPWKNMFFAFNFILALCGLGVIKVGWLIIDGFKYNLIPIQELGVVLENEFLLKDGPFLPFAYGTLLFLVAICGCLGVVTKDRRLLVFYFVFILLMSVAQLVAGFLAAVYSKEVIPSFMEIKGREFLATEFKRKDGGIRNLGTNGAAWDIVQEKLKCCGVTGKEDYQDNIHITTPYPGSCCMNLVKPYPGETWGGDRAPCNWSDPKPFQEGCKNGLQNLFLQYSIIIAVSALAIAGVEIWFLFFACLICIMKLRIRRQRTIIRKTRTIMELSVLIIFVLFVFLSPGLALLVHELLESYIW